MTSFNTYSGCGEHKIVFETTNQEHYEYMQKAARICVDGEIKAERDSLAEQNKAYALDARVLRKQHEKDCQTIDNLRAELDATRNCMDKSIAELDRVDRERNAARRRVNELQAELKLVEANRENLNLSYDLISKDRDHWKERAEERKKIYNIAMQILAEAGVNMDRFTTLVARTLVDMERKKK